MRRLQEAHEELGDDARLIEKAKYEMKNLARDDYEDEVQYEVFVGGADVALVANFHYLLHCFVRRM